MPGFSVEVPTGSIGITPLEPREWAGYPPNTVLTVWPNEGELEGASEFEITLSGIDPEAVLPQLEGVPMTINALTSNSMIVQSPSTIGGPFRGTFLPNPVKRAWMSTQTAAIKDEFIDAMAVAWLWDKEIVSQTAVSFVDAAEYTNDYFHNPGTGTSRMDMGVVMHALTANTTTPQFLLLAEVRVADAGVWNVIGDSDWHPAWYGWMLQAGPSNFQMILGDGGTAGSSNGRYLNFTYASITDYTHASNTWFQMALQVSSLTTGKICINGGAVFNPSSTSGTGSTYNVGSILPGVLGAYYSGGFYEYSDIDIRHLCILRGNYSDAEIQAYCQDPYQFYRKA